MMRVGPSKAVASIGRVATRLPPRLRGPVHQGFEVGVVAGAPARAPWRAWSGQKTPQGRFALAARGRGIGPGRGRDHQGLGGSAAVDVDGQAVVAGGQVDRERAGAARRTARRPSRPTRHGEFVGVDRPVLGRPGLVHDQPASDWAEAWSAGRRTSARVGPPSQATTTGSIGRRQVPERRSPRAAGRRSGRRRPPGRGGRPGATRSDAAWTAPEVSTYSTWIP